jgi:hypothetical protein
MFEPTVRVVPRIIKEELKITISQRSPGRVKIEGLYRIGLNQRWLMLLGVEFEDVVSVAVFRRLDLFEEILVAEEP